MIIDNVRVVAKDRTPHACSKGFMHTGETYYYMLEKTERDPCLIFDVTVLKGDMKPFAPEKFVHEFMEKNFPETVYYLEQHNDAFDSMRAKLHGEFEGAGKAFVYYYCYSNDREAISKLERFVRSKPFMAKVEKHLAGDKK